MSKKRYFKELRDAYRFPYFTPSKQVHGIFGDPYAIVLTLSRRQKKHNAVVVGGGNLRIGIGGHGLSEIFLVAVAGYISRWKFAELFALSAMP